jgi:hypothetical protein
MRRRYGLWFEDKNKKKLEMIVPPPDSVGFNPPLWKKQL